LQSHLSVAFVFLMQNFEHPLSNYFESADPYTPTTVASGFGRAT